VLRSTDPTDRGLVANTIIDGNKAGSVVTFAGVEDESCVLSGFTIRNGQAAVGGGICGGTEMQHTHATIEHNVIVDNRGNNAAGLAYCDGLIQNNVIRGNSAPGPNYGDAGAFGWCDGLIQNNLVVGNSAARNAGGFYCCNGTIRNNTIMGNRAYYGGLESCGGAIYNCIIWESGFFGSFPNVTYCCVQEGWGGEGNIGDDPLFVDADGPDGDPNTYEDNDYRLQSDSPCIDKGKTEEWMWRAVDLDVNPRVLPGVSSWRVDMGAYEYMPANLPAVAIQREESGGMRIIRITRPGERYILQSCLDLLLRSWNEEAIVPSEGSLTTWIEPDTAPRWKFYRIEIR
jgi:hypothetical protein